MEGYKLQRLIYTSHLYSLFLSLEFFCITIFCYGFNSAAIIRHCYPTVPPTQREIKISFAQRHTHTSIAQSS